MRKSYSHEQDGILHVDVMKLTWDIDVIEDIEGNLLCVCTLINVYTKCQISQMLLLLLKKFSATIQVKVTSVELKIN